MDETPVTQSPAAERKWLTVKEVAQELLVSKMSIYRAVADDNFPAVRLGNTIRVPAAALDELAKHAINTGKVIDLADWREVLMAG